MGIGNFDSGDDGQDDNQDPSGTHLYFYQRGHERLPGEEGDAGYEKIATAYELAKSQPTNGRVRTFADNNFGHGLQEMLAEFVMAMGDSIEEETFSPVLSWALEDFPAEAQAEMVADYLDDNPEVREELAERFESTEDE
jgi:hypothetical protein